MAPLHRARNSRSARGSHMCPVLDMDGDGVDELLWGERRIELENGQQLWCADEMGYGGHSDVIQPVWDEKSGRWLVFTCRESHPGASPRIITFDDRGQRVWGHVEHGHIDMGWAARLGPQGEKQAMGIRIGHKVCGPDGRFHHDYDVFLYDAFSGEPVQPPVSLYGTLPVDLDGDGCHELVCGAPGADGTVFDRFGNEQGSVGGSVALAQKFCALPGEQLLVYKLTGEIEIWADREAQDSAQALERYENRFYQLNRRFTSTGYNLAVLGGL